MADIKPFRAIHPAAGLHARVASLPYDVFNEREAREQAALDEIAFINIDRPETQFEEGHDMYAPEVYQKAHDLLWDQVSKGVYAEDETENYYLYELTMNGRTQTGIVAAAAVDDYVSGVIKKHENTRAEKEQDRIRHVRTCDAQTGPIFLAYRSDERIRRVTDRVRQTEADFDFVSPDGIRHRGWTVSGSEDQAVIREAFKGMDQVYIADGHHRAASAVKSALACREEARAAGQAAAGEYDHFLSVLFPDDELMILPYNRVVRDLNGLSPEAFLEALSRVATVTKAEGPVEPANPKTCGLYLADTWYNMIFNDEVCSQDPVEGLDVSILQRQVLSPILGIEDPRTDHRIDFIGGIRGLSELEKRVHTDCAVAFSMYPTSIRELFDVADAGLLMPPKSTWFEPKLRSGLFIHRLH